MNHKYTPPFIQPYFCSNINENEKKTNMKQENDMQIISQIFKSVTLIIALKIKIVHPKVLREKKQR